MRRTSMAATMMSLGVATLASATPIGTLDIAGLGDAQLHLQLIDFGPGIGLGPSPLVVTGADGSFASVALGSTGTIADYLDVGAGTSDSFVVVPSTSPRFVFDVQVITYGDAPSCAVPPAVGESCWASPSQSPLLMTQHADGVEVAFGVAGTVTDLLDGSTAPYKGLFTLNFARERLDTVPELLAGISPSSRNAVTSSWSAQLTVVPESETATLLGVAMVGVAVGRRRRRPSSASRRHTPSVTSAR